MSNYAGEIDLLPLNQMANSLGVPSRWLREQAEIGNVPALRAGNRWLFAPEITRAAVREMAGKASNVVDANSQKGGTK